MNSRGPSSDIEAWESQLTCGFITGMDLDVDALMAR
jgi:hypothetical protein